MDDCIFCKIIKKEIPAKIIFENEKTLAFLNIHPLSAGHTLVIPKTHSEHFVAMEEEDAVALSLTAHRVAQLLTKKLGAPGMNILANCAKAGGQEIFHTHFHLIPRYEEDGIIHFHRAEEDSTPLDTVYAEITNHQ